MLHTRLLKTTALRLSLLYALLFSLLSAASLGFLYWATGHYINVQISTGLHTEVTELQDIYTSHGDTALRRVLIRRLLSTRNDGRHYFYSPTDGRPTLGDLHAWPAKVHATGKVQNVWIDSKQLPLREQGDRDQDDDQYLSVLAVKLADGSRLLIGQTLHNAEDIREFIFGIVLATLGVTIALALMLGVLMGRSVLRRIDAVNRTAGEIMAGDLTRRIPVTGRQDEYDELALRLNAMLTRIEQLMTAMRQVTDNVAHDLRSPLTRLRSRLEVTLLEHRDEAEYRDAMEQAISDADQLLKTFNALLSIAQAEAGVRRDEAAQVDVSTLVIDLGELYSAVAEEAGLQLEVRNSAAIHLRVNRHLLAQVIGNLLENAIKYTPPTGHHLTLALARDGERVRLSVSDDGPGIPAEARERVLERFERLDQTRSTRGNGLGLSLVRAVAQLYGAQLHLLDNTPGLRVELVFTPGHDNTAQTTTTPA